MYNVKEELIGVVNLDQVCFLVCLAVQPARIAFGQAKPSRAWLGKPRPTATLTAEYAPRRSYFPSKVTGISSIGMLKVRRLLSSDICIQNCVNPLACFSQNWKNIVGTERGN